MITAAGTPPTSSTHLRPPLLVFGGPYSNVRAATALRAHAAVLGIDAMHTICTGDIVAYCAEPEETVAAIREWGCHVVAGNCEEQLASDADDCGCGFVRDSNCDRLAKDWYAFARRRISADSRAWMAGLPKALLLTVAGRTVRVIHGGVDRINRFVFASQHKLIAGNSKRPVPTSSLPGTPVCPSSHGSVGASGSTLGLSACLPMMARPTSGTV